MKRSSKPIEFNNQEGRRTKWLLKLDEHGCLIPGCHLADATVAAIAPEIKLAIYPNPATNYLNFQLRSARPVQEATFRILDAGGRTVKEFNSSGHPGDTMIVPLSGWAAGVYFLEMSEKGAVLATERFAIR
ncbi:MAG: T9SS type A sorting domain-containing protein [Lewinellaceae bacterium]|nr:T9SS type A sorting domain-containing protein [Saprospiraceae bacterium]MCB9337381.1 T9SS type A sorting domain-containing protein [Lewinellaceae bacterium]